MLGACLVLVYGPHSVVHISIIMCKESNVNGGVLLGVSAPRGVLRVECDGVE